MEAFKNLTKNIALFLFIGAVPSLCWAGGFFAAVSWTSFFLILSAMFCILWLKSWNSAHISKNLLLAKGEEWAICEGDQFIDRSPHFPAESLSTFKTFLHPDSLAKLQTPLAHLLHENVPFQMRVNGWKRKVVYTLKGTACEGKIILLLKNITEEAHQEQTQLERMQKNEKLLQKLQSTFDLMPLLAWHRDDHQKITYCNFAYARAVQDEPQKVCEEEIELIQPRVAKTLARKALHTQELHALTSPAIANGERRHFRICEMPNPQGGGTFGIAYDVTELKEATLEIKRLTDAHNTVLDHMSTAIAVHDAEGILQYHNQAYVGLHSFDKEFLKTKPGLDEVLEDLRHRRQLPEHPDFPTFKKSRLLKLTEQIESEEEMMHLPDERTLCIFSVPHPLGGLLFMFEDVTKYLALERQNKTLFDAYQTTLDSLFEGIIVVGSDNRLKMSNPSFINLWNLTKEDIKPGQHLTHVIEKMNSFFDDDQEAGDSFNVQIMENLADRTPKTGQLLRKDEMVVDFRYVPLPNGDHLLSYIAMMDESLVQYILPKIFSEDTDQEEDNPLEQVNA